MGRQQGEKKQKKDKVVAAPVKRGRVIDRRRNRTVSQDIARSAPKWKNVGTFDRPVLEQIVPKGQAPAHIALKGGRWQSVTKKVAEYAMAEQAAISGKKTHTETAPKSPTPDPNVTIVDRV